MGFLQDSFTAADSTALENHAPEKGGAWSKHPSYTDDADIQGNAAGLAAGNSEAVYLNDVDPGSPDYTVEAVFSLSGDAETASSRIMAILRADPTQNTFYRMGWNGGSTNRIQVQKVMGGSGTPLAETDQHDFSEVSTFRIVAQVVGDTLTCDLDIGNTGSIDDTVSVQDSDLTEAGRAGFRFNSTYWRVDSVTVTSEHVLQEDDFSVASDTPITSHVSSLGVGYADADTADFTVGTDGVRQTEDVTQHAIIDTLVSEVPEDQIARVKGTLGDMSVNRTITAVVRHNGNPHLADNSPEDRDAYILQLASDDGWLLRRAQTGAEYDFAQDASYTTNNGITASTVIEIELKVQTIDESTVRLTGRIRLDDGDWDEVVVHNDTTHLLRGGRPGFGIRHTEPRVTSFYAAALSDEESSNWYNTAWPYRRRVTLHSSRVSGTHAGFPWLLDITDSRLGSEAQANGADILFTSDDQVTKLDHEVVSFDSATGRLVAYVRTDVSDAADTDLYLYYGNASAPDQSNAAGVWAETNLTQHYEEDPTGGVASDSSPLGNDGTVNGTPDAIAGPSGQAWDFQGDTESVEIPADTSLQFGTSDWAVLAWLRPTDLLEGTTGSGADRYFLSGGIDSNDYWYLRFRNTTRWQMIFTIAGTEYGSFADMSPGLVNNDWVLFGFNCDRATESFQPFINGTPTGDAAFISTPPADLAIGGPFRVGVTWNQNQPWNGGVDGLRFFKGSLLTADYCATVYDVERAADSNYTLWSEETESTVDNPQIGNLTVTVTGSQTAVASVSTDQGDGTLYWVVTNSLTSPSVAQVQAGQDHNGNPAAASGSQSVSATGEQDISLSSLDSSTTYYLHCQHQNAAGDNSEVLSSGQFTTLEGGIQFYEDWADYQVGDDPTVDPPAGETEPRWEYFGDAGTATFTIVDLGDGTKALEIFALDENGSERGFLALREAGNALNAEVFARFDSAWDSGPWHLRAAYRANGTLNSGDGYEIRNNMHRIRRIIAGVETYLADLRPGPAAEHTIYNQVSRITTDIDGDPVISARVWTGDKVNDDPGTDVFEVTDTDVDAIRDAGRFGIGWQGRSTATNIIHTVYGIGIATDDETAPRDIVVTPEIAFSDLRDEAGNLLTGTVRYRWYPDSAGTGTQEPGNLNAVVETGSFSASSGVGTLDGVTEGAGWLELAYHDGTQWQTHAGRYTVD